MPNYLTDFATPPLSWTVALLLLVGWVTLQGTAISQISGRGSAVLASGLLWGIGVLEILPHEIAIPFLVALMLTHLVLYWRPVWVVSSEVPPAVHWIRTAVGLIVLGGIWAANTYFISDSSSVNWFLLLLVAVSAPLVTAPLIAKLRDGVQAVFLFALTLILTLPTHYAFALDEAEWLFMAKALISGHGLVDISGNPSWYRSGYVALYAVANVIGPNLGAAVLPFLGFACFIVLMFIFGMRMYGRLASGLGVLLLLMTPRERVVTPQLIDGASAATCLLVYLLVVAPPKRKELLYGILIGAFAFVAFLIKETVLLALFLPILLTVTGTGNISRARLMGVYGAVLVLVGGFLLLTGFGSPGGEHYFQSPDLAVQWSGAIRNDGDIWSTLTEMVGHVARGLWAYFYDPSHFSTLLHFAPQLLLLPFALGSSVWRVVRGGEADRIVLLALLPWLLLMGQVGWLDWRPEQGLTAVALLHLLTGKLLVDSFSRLRFRTIMPIATATVMCYGIFQLDHYLFLYWNDVRNTELNALVGGWSPTLKTRFKGSQELFGFASANFRENSRIWASAPLPALSASLATKVHYWIAPFPLDVIVAPGVQGRYVQSASVQAKRRIWGVFAGPAFDSKLGDLPSKRPLFFLIYKDDLLSARTTVSHVLVSSGSWPWLRNLPDMLAPLFDQIGSFDSSDFGTSLAFSWDENAFRTNIEKQFVHHNVIEELNFLRANDAPQFEWVTNTLRAAGIDLSAQLTGSASPDRKANSLQVVHSHD